MRLFIELTLEQQEDALNKYIKRLPIVSAFKDNLREVLLNTNCYYFDDNLNMYVHFPEPADEYILS